MCAVTISARISTCSGARRRLLVFVEAAGDQRLERIERFDRLSANRGDGDGRTEPGAAPKPQNPLF